MELHLQSLIERGYLPKELPSAFTSATFAKYAASTQLPGSIASQWTQPTTVNLARPGSLRRPLAIQNPLSFWGLASIICNEWQELHAHNAKSAISISRPVPRSSGRALQHSTPFSRREAERVQRMIGARYTVRSDITQFYASIYTHSIEWALHTKQASKSALLGKGKKNSALTLGAVIDKNVRNAQDGQTKGIPVGPDTSFLLAEVIMAAVDADLQERMPQSQGRLIRMMDDLEFFAQSQSEAEELLGNWDSLLREFDLSINETKTTITPGVRLSEPIWRTTLARFQLRNESDRLLTNDLYSYFAVAFDLAEQYPGDYVLSYAIGRVRPVPSGGESWRAFQHLILAAATADPSVLSHVFRALRSAAAKKIPIDRDLVEVTLNHLCMQHSSLEHGSEVAWSLAIIRFLGGRVRADVASNILKMADNTCIILAMDAVKSEKIDGSEPDTSAVLERAEAAQAHHGRDWLLAYECTRLAWAANADLVSDAPWAALLKSEVRFYEEQAAGDKVKSALTAGVDLEPGPADGAETEELDADENSEY